MHLGLSSYTYGWAVGTDPNRPPNALTALDLIDRTAAFNLNLLQICDNLPPETYTDASVETIAAHAQNRGVHIELGTRGIADDHLARFARLARRLGSPILRCVIDTPTDHPSPDQVVTRLARLLPHFAEQNVILAIENHDRFPAATLADMIRRLNSPFVGICLDTANSFGALEGPPVVVDALGPYVVNLHLKDFAIRRLPHLQGFIVEGRPAGQGMLNIPWLLSRLHDLGRNVNAILELWTPPENTVQETIAKEALWAQQSLRTLRQWIKTKGTTDERSS